jgi:hypothetical protein
MNSSKRSRSERFPVDRTVSPVLKPNDLTELAALLHTCDSHLTTKNQGKKAISIRVRVDGTVIAKRENRTRRVDKGKSGQALKTAVSGGFGGGILSQIDKTNGDSFGGTGPRLLRS